jgi:hypothetical protein
MQVITTSVAEGLRSAIATRTDLIANPMNIVGVGMELMNKYPTLSGSEKKALLVKALTNFASGKDGILGTADDNIPKPIIDTITNLIQGNLIGDVINFAAEVAKGRFNPAAAVEVVKQANTTFSGCFGFLMSKFKKTEPKKIEPKKK